MVSFFQYTGSVWIYRAQGKSEIGTVFLAVPYTRWSELVPWMAFFVGIPDLRVDVSPSGCEKISIFCDFLASILTKIDSFPGSGRAVLATLVKMA